MTDLTRNQIIAAAAGTLEMLEILGQAEREMSLREIVAFTGRPKGTVHRMVSTLVNTGYATHDVETGKYALTLKAWRIGAGALRRLDLVEHTRPILANLCAESRETVHLSVLDASGVVYVAKVESPKSIGVQTRLGQLSPAWCTATGRAILAFNAADADRALSGVLERRTPHTETDPARLRKLLAEVRERGYAVTRAENHPEMGGVAAPIRDHSGQVVAALGVAMPEYRMSPEVVEAAIPSVMRAAVEASRVLGHVEPSPTRHLHAG
jgi:IclR family KDG regulon transcriptional repressor